MNNEKRKNYTVGVDLGKTIQKYQADDELLRKLVDGKTAAEVKGLEQRLKQVREKTSVLEITDAEMDFAQAMADDSSNSFVFEGLGTGYHTLDSYLLGVKPGDVVVLGGYTNLGKSTLSLDWCLNFAKQGANVLYFALEDNEREMNTRGKALLQGKGLTTDDMKGWAGKFYRYPMAKKLEFFRNKFGVISAIEELAMTREINVICLDMLNDLVDPINDRDADSFMVELKDMCDSHNFTLLTTTRLREPKGLTQKSRWKERYAPDEDSIYGRGMIKYLATKIITIAPSATHPPTLAMGLSGVDTSYLALSVCKNRSGGNTKRASKVITLKFTRGVAVGMKYEDLGAEGIVRDE